MQLSTSRYLRMRGLLRAAVSCNYPPLANPSEADLLKLFGKLMVDSAGASAPQSLTRAGMAAALRALLSGDSGQPNRNPNDDEVSAFLAQLNAESASASAPTAAAYASFRSILRDALSSNPQGGANPTDQDVLGFFASYGIPASTLDLLYFDARALAANEGDVTGSLPSQTANTLASVGSPTIDANAIGGRQAVYCYNGPTGNLNLYYLTCNALASRFTLGQTATIIYRARITSTGFIELFGAGSSGSNTTGFVRVLYNTGTNVIQIISVTPGGATTTRTASAVIGFDEFVLALVQTASTYALYLNGVALTLDVNTVDAAAYSCDRFAFSAQLTSGANATSSTYIQGIFASSTAMSAAQVAAFTTQIQAGDATVPMATRPVIARLGDSLSDASQSVSGKGWPGLIVQRCIDNGLSLAWIGYRSVGAFPQRATFALAGSDLLTIANNFTGNLGSGKPALYIFLGGTNNQTQSQAQASADYDTALAQIDAAAKAALPAVRGIVWTIPPFQPGTNPNTTNEPVFNAALPAKWDAFDRANPSRKLYRFDAKAAVNGGVWSGTYWGDATHWNDAGYAIIAAALWLQFGSVFRALSPTINALACSLTVPAYGATLPNATPVTLTAIVTRTDCSVQFFRDSGVPIGAATMNSVSGNGKTGTLAWTPGAQLDKGAHVIYAIVTDPISNETAQSPFIPVTVT